MMPFGFLPEIHVEQRTQDHYAERGDNIPLVPTIPDKGFVVACEGDKLNLLGGWFFSKE